MPKTRKNSFKIRVVIERGAIIFLLTVLWFFLSFSYINATSGVTILLHNHGEENITHGDKSELTAGEKIKGEFTAKEDNLGIVAVRFNTFFHINSDSVIFRVREKGAKKWYYQHSYLVDQFQPNQLFTFGFPIIANSNKKIYEFEVESEKGRPKDAVALSYAEPIFVSKYQYPKERILNDREYLLTFMYRKAFNAFSNIDFLFSSLIYALPLLVYIVKVFFFDKYFADKYLISLVPIGLMIMLSVFDLPRNDDAIIGVTGLWIVLNLAYYLNSSITFVCAMIFLIFSPIFLYLNIEHLSRIFAMWGFMLLTAGVILQIIELVWKRRKLMTFSEFIFPNNVIKHKK